MRRLARDQEANDLASSRTTVGWGLLAVRQGPTHKRPRARPCDQVPWWGMAGTRLPMFPLSAVLFPHASMPLHVFEPRYRELMRECLDGDRRFGVVLIERGVGGGRRRHAGRCRDPRRHHPGRRAARRPLAPRGHGRDGRGDRRVAPGRPLPAGAGARARPGAAARGPRTPARRRGRAGAPGPRLLSEHGGGPPLEPGLALDGGGDVERAAWHLCGAAPVNAYDAQRLLAADGATARLGLVVELMDDLELDLRRMLAE